MRNIKNCRTLKTLSAMKKTPPEIRILSDDVANKIAAGEVIERPAAVAKELLENSIDAGATRIEIEFKHGGKSFVKVVDDGCGMTRQQALTCLEPHATSKIRAPEDLFRISSYGFRGEAVPSMASVSRFKIRTKPESQVLGTEIDVYAGSVNSVRDCGMAAGTEIIVENLFCSVPARRKFLKSDNVEASHIVKLCRLYALALPDLSITLVENSRVVFRSERGLKTLDRIERIFGGDISSKLSELKKTQTEGISVEGAILRAGESFPTSRNICAFINGRPVECKAVYSAIKEAYSQYVPKGRFAAAFLFIELDPQSVDVNVHPAKREVRLKNEIRVRDFLCETISAALCESQNKTSAANAMSADDASGGRSEARGGLLQYPPSAAPRPAFTPRDDFEPSSRLSPAAFPHSENAPDFPAKKTFAGNEDSNVLRGDGGGNPRRVSEKSAANSVGDVRSAQAKSAYETVAEQWRYVGCLKKRFALFETAKGLVIMSISAALKRVRFERILKNLRGEKVVSQNLLIPLTLKFERGDEEYFSANRTAFEMCGFGLEDFGKSFYRIVSVPIWLKYEDAENFIRDFVELAREESKSLRKSKLSDENFARALVGRIGAANFQCGEISATELLAQLLSGANHMSSPDGKPTLKEISEAEMARMFSM